MTNDHITIATDPYLGATRTADGEGVNIRGAGEIITIGMDDIPALIAALEAFEATGGAEGENTHPVHEREAQEMDHEVEEYGGEMFAAAPSGAPDNADTCPECGGALDDSLGGKACAECGWSE